MSFGVLALQGDFEAHLRILRRVGVEAGAVRHAGELSSLAGLVIPGGESTTLLNLMADEPWGEAIRGLHGRGAALLGTCAGAILLAREVRPAQASLGLVDVTIERNAYGRQVDSFEARLDAPALGGGLRAVFIRAPRIRGAGPGVEVLARLDGEPVLVRQGRVLAATFHPELADDTRLHAAFAEAGAVALARE
ncbi:MAG TPA: pyridoxal 5'-phosphate synthase glutaminase subunit PdxT [Vicinamibacteria bacterium]|nr:pyridoxal 5'-phosphate synthase glutaminase subunit PdxT [Vicinamibacteria bacterium]